jgi:hypothetical protein
MKIVRTQGQAESGLRMNGLHNAGLAFGEGFLWRTMVSLMLAVDLAAADPIFQRVNELSVLREQGVAPRQIIGLDRRGVPMVCGTSGTIDSGSVAAMGEEAARRPPPPDLPPPVLPVGTRMWETIPGVVRNNGIDTFRLEVNANGPVSNVTMEVWSPTIAESGAPIITLRDDGLNGDRIAGDYIYTSELLRFDTRWAGLEPRFYNYDTNSPAGVNIEWVGNVTITESNGQQAGFLHLPQVGVLNSNIPPVRTVTLSSNVVVSGHLLNVKGTNLSAQKFVRAFTLGTADLTALIYAVLPDRFDFFICFSTYRIERLPATTSANFIAGVHRDVKVNYTGTGQGLVDRTATYGSGGRLLGVNGLDCYERGIWSHNCTHEILHQWGSYLGVFPISDGQHYNPRSSVGSLLGGHLWRANGDSTWNLICEEGRNGATHLDPLDKYLMGLIPGNQVPTLRVYDESYPFPYSMCGQSISNVQYTVGIADIAGYYGPRSPGPTTAQRNFSLGFIAESNGRLLNQTEMTFYDTLAEHYTKPIPPEWPDPYVGQSWPSIDRFFGEGTTWRSEVLSLIEPVIRSVERFTDGQVRVTASGLPGRTYQLQGSSSLQSWVNIASQTAGTNGTLVVTDATAAQLKSRFYRLISP